MGKELQNGYVYVKDVLDGNTFYIPTMQRGYRWDEKNVRQLLEDIYEDKLIEFGDDDDANIDKISEKRKDVFNLGDDKKINTLNPAKDPYCIQPLVVCQKDGKTEDYYDVIDGQQRLTTITIILKAMKAICQGIDIPEVPLGYDSRENSADFLKKIGSSASDKSNIDFEYMQNAYDTAKDFFTEFSVGLSDYPMKRYFQYLLDVLMLNTRFIWYKVDGTNSHVVFQNFNSGKLDLTDSELVKALFMDASRYSSENIDDKRIVISEKWDEIENQLHDADFWAFVPHVKQYEAGDYTTRIDVIFEFLIMKKYLESGMDLNSYLEYRKKNSSDRYIFEEMNKYLEEKKRSWDKTADELMSKCWYDVRKIYLGLLDLYQRDTIGDNDNKIYNMVGLYINLKNRKNNSVDGYDTRNPFLFLEVYYALSEVMKASRSGQGNRLDKMKELIRKELGYESIKDRSGLETKIKSIRHSYANEENVDTQADNIVKTLLAYNLGLLNRTEGMGQRFAFKSFAEHKWQREHIFATNLKEAKNKQNGLDTDEERKAALKILADDPINDSTNKEDATKNAYVDYVLDLYFPNYKINGVDYIGQTLDFADDEMLNKYIESNQRYDKKESPAIMLARALRARSDSKKMLGMYDLIDRIDQAMNCDEDLKHILLYGILKELDRQFCLKEYVSVEDEIEEQKIAQNDDSKPDYEFVIDGKKYTVVKNVNYKDNATDQYSNYIRSLYMEDMGGKNLADDYKLIDSDKITKWSELEMVFSRCVSTLRKKIDDFFSDWFMRLLYDNTMGNMTLLTGGEQGSNDESQNQTVGNKSYKLKKSIVHRFMKEGQFVPLGTMMVFSDMYNEGMNAANFWLPDSRKKYLDDIIDTLNEFLIS